MGNLITSYLSSTCSLLASTSYDPRTNVSEKPDEAYCVTARDAISTGLEVSLYFLKKNNYLTDYDDIAEAYRIILDVSSSFFFLSSSMLNIMMKWSNL